MTAGTHAPADTRTMGIVHSALRRDLERTRMVLDANPHPEGPRRQALADHLLWMMRFLHMHHSGEDAGLWPLIRERNPAAAALLDEMDADHQRIATTITGLEAAAREYRDDGGARERLLSALAALRSELLPHLRREELDMMPVVAVTITDAEYRAVEHEYFVKPKGFLELATEAHWVRDGLAAEGRELIVRLVPAVPRFVILHGFARSYRRKRALLWGDGPPAALPSLELAATDGLS
jgi:hemerythrin HHE cation binding domain-containing protein